MMMPATRFLNRKFSRASVYAANVPKISVSSVVTPATTTLLSRLRPNPTPGANTAVKFSNDIGLGKNELSAWSFGWRSAETTIQ